MSAFRGKADIKRYCEESPLLTHSGHWTRDFGPRQWSKYRSFRTAPAKVAISRVEMSVYAITGLLLL
jgi:hypothetical protein